MSTIKELLSVYDAMKDSASAAEQEEWLLQACAEAESLEPDQILKISVLYNELGSFYRYQRRLEEGEAAFLKAKAYMETKVCENVTGCKCCYYTASLPDDLFGFEESSPESKTANYATILNNLAGNYRLQKRFEEAEDLFKQAIAIYNEHPEIPTALLCSAYNNLALVYLDQGRYKEAVRVFSGILEKLKSSPGDLHEKATTCANMAVAWLQDQNREQAAACIREAETYYQAGGLTNTQEYKAFQELKKVLQES